ncbi:MAG TPA: hypothetical protein VJ552_08435 [Sediminibacterium sp.]|nr:hypothetical protein [Sediminibacterium sp.]
MKKCIILYTLPGMSFPAFAQSGKSVASLPHRNSLDLVKMAMGADEEGPPV